MDETTPKCLLTRRLGVAAAIEGLSLSAIPAGLERCRGEEEDDEQVDGALEVIATISAQVNVLSSVKYPYAHCAEVAFIFRTLCSVVA